MRVLLGLVTWAVTASAALAAPLQPLKSTVSGIPLAQMLGTAETLGEWKLLNGNGDLRLVQVLSKEGGECEASDDDDSNLCPRYMLFAVLDGELADPTGFTVYQLPETLGWTLPKNFKPDETSETSNVPLHSCEMKRTSKGFGWRGVSYRLRVTEKIVGGKAGFSFSASLEKLPGERADCSIDR
jgi:hypothetical protein